MEMDDTSLNYILVIGWNSAVQKTLEFEDFVIGEVNRAKALYLGTGGKGQNFCISTKVFLGAPELGHLGSESVNNVQKSDVILFHFEAGQAGDFVNQELNRREIKHIAVDVPHQNTRTCTTIVNHKTMEATEVIEPSIEVSSEQKFQMMEHIKVTLSRNSQQIKAIAICGTSPGGIDAAESYLGIASLASSYKQLVFVDAVKGISEKIMRHVGILKVNKQEFEVLTEMILKRKCNSIDEAATELLHLFKENLKVIAITAGNLFIDPVCFFLPFFLHSFGVCLSVTLSWFFRGGSIFSL